MKPASPCLGCTDREFRCHSNCNRYIDFKNEMQIIHDIREKALREQDDFMKSKVRKK